MALLLEYSWAVAALLLLKGLMTGAAALAASQAIAQPILNFVPNLSSGLQLVLNVLLALGAAAVPICIGMAILRYRHRGHAGRFAHPRASTWMAPLPP